MAKEEKANPANPTNPVAAKEAPALAEAPKRTRLSFSKDKKLAYLIAGLVTILKSKAVATVLTNEQKIKVNKAEVTAKEIGGGDALKPITDRIAAIKTELEAAAKLMSTDMEKATAQIKELGTELDRQIKRKKQIEEMING